MMEPTPVPPALVIRYAMAILRQPRVWLPTVRLILSVKPRSGRGSLPSRRYLEFRLHTLGPQGAPPTPAEFIVFVEWADRYRRR